MSNKLNYHPTAVPLKFKPPDFPDVSADASLGNFLEDLSEHFDVFLALGEFVATIRLRGFVWYCLYFGETQKYNSLQNNGNSKVFFPSIL